MIIVLSIILVGCDKPNPNRELETEIKQEMQIPLGARGLDYAYRQKVYVPIYSDIYNKRRSSKVLLTATLSIRNTSMVDSLFIEKVDYYNTEGELVRNYIENPIFLKPLETIDYVIEEEDEVGGTGANFILQWGAHSHVTPIFQGVMVGTIGQHGFAFTTNGIKID